MTMKAVRWHGAKNLRIETVPIPKISANQVLLRVHRVGICGTDLHEYLAGPIFIPQESPHIYSGQKAPLTLGHEFAGEIVEIGAEVKNFKVGDRVVVEPILARFGLVGAYNLDSHIGFVGLSCDGGMAEYCAVDAGLLHLLPDSLDYEQGALVEPAAVAVYAVQRSEVQVGQRAAVFGCGPIGLLIIEALRAAGVYEVYCVELSKERRKKAEELGGIAVDPSTVNAVEFIKDVTQGGVDVSFEVTGVPVVLQQSLASVSNSGTCVVVSIWEREASIQPNELVIGEKSMKGTIAYRNVFPGVMQLMQRGFFGKDKLVTKKIALDKVVEEGFELLAKDKQQVKILINPSA